MELRLLSLIETSLHQTGSVYSGNEVAFHCPVCNLEKHKQKLVVNLDRNSKRFGYWHCWNCRESMGTGGKTLYTLFKKMNVNSDSYGKLNTLLGENKIVYAKKKEKIYDDIRLPTEFNSLLKEKNTPEYKNAFNYVSKRGITHGDIIKYNIGYCETGRYARRIVIPSYDSDGILNYFVTRSYYSSVERKYLNPKIDKDKIIFFESNINYSYPILLVEGVFDAIAAKRNAIPLLGKTINSELKRKIIINNVKTIYLSLDADAMKASLKHINNLLSEDIDVKLVKLDKGDPSDLGYHNFIKLYKESKSIDFSELVKLKLLYGN